MLLYIIYTIYTISPRYHTEWSLGALVRLTHQRHSDHRTPKYDARIECESRMTHGWHRCILACTRGMTPEWHQRHQDDTHASPPTPPEAKAWDHWIAKVPQEAQQTNQPQKRALAVKWRLRTHSWISLQKTFLIKSAKLFPNNFQNKSVFYLTKSSDGQKIACAAH